MKSVALPRGTVRQEARTSHFTIRLWDAEDIIDELARIYETLSESLRTSVPFTRVSALVPGSDLSYLTPGARDPPENGTYFAPENTLLGGPKVALTMPRDADGCADVSQAVSMFSGHASAVVLLRDRRLHVQP